ncbi:MAG: PSD1 and planctomycete cytochrome C domain-containing protein [Acidobacteriota bacterium]|nr:PSD1 and planctomycete cytochrome C domain-containing protein [Acidobacteriota bacterium]
MSNVVNHKNEWRERAVFGFVGLTMVCVVASAGAQTRSVAGDGGDGFFENVIRPLLVDRCFQCHSGRSDTPAGGLRLDSRETVLTGGDTGPAVVPGDSRASLLVQRVQGRPVLMPPTGALVASEIENLITWIDMGAPWPENAVVAATPDPSEPFDLNTRRREHWAWQPIQRTVPSTVRDVAWPQDAVDQFILASLEGEGLAPSAAADRSTLIRRLSFDLRGLPPTPAEIARFVGDPSPAAYTNLVDRYLQTPHFGERWARHWMDLFRYTESHGSEGDPDIPLAWRYRDYLIRAFNADVPYDQLIREHIAGDLLPTPRLDQARQLNESIIGTAHYRLVEHGYQPVDPWEDRVKWADNQVDVVSKAFLGLTVSCARCHDHKFDAISQKDYYSLFGTLYGARPTQRAIDDPAWLDTNKRELDTLKHEIRNLLADAWVEAADALGFSLLDEWDTNGDDHVRRESAADVESTGGSVLAAWRELAALETNEFSRAWLDLETRWTGEIADREQFNREHFEVAWDFSGADYASTVGHGTGRPDAPSAPGEFTIERRGDQMLTGIYPGGVYTHLLSSKHAGVIQTPRFTIDTDHISLRVLGGDLSFAVLIIENYAVPRGGIYHLRYSPKADEMAWAQWDTSFWKGFSAYIEFATQDDVTQFTLDPEDVRQPNRPTRRGDGRSAIGVNRVLFHDVEEVPRDTVLPVLEFFGGVDAPPTSREELASLIGRLARDVVSAWKQGLLTEQQAVFLDELVRADLLPRSLDALETLRAPVARYRLLERDVPVARRAPGVVEEAAPDQPLLVRGSHTRLGDVVPRAFLTALDAEPYPAPSTVRLRLADAITAPGNPLTARVAVNRVWRHLFGNGLVRTVDNFGRLGATPSHPALLDHLATTFADDAYSIKRLVRRLVLSRTYQMSSRASSLALEKDPSNRLLQHASLRRLDAEAIRDSILSVSGRLDSTLYGPSIPVHYATRHGLTEGDPDNGPVDGHGRRSIYQEIRRNAHNPFLEVFDLPKPATTRGQRDTTNVPAQSLTMLNSPFVIGQAAEWGRRLAEGEAGTINGRLDHMFIKALARTPTDTERRRIVGYLTTVASERETLPHLLLYDVGVWQDVAHSLFNLKEYLFIQ